MGQSGRPGLSAGKLEKPSSDSLSANSAFYSSCIGDCLAAAPLHCADGSIIQAPRPVGRCPASGEQLADVQSNQAPRRPLSPHLQVYRPMLTMMMSITHRITGAGLYFGTLLLAWWLIAAATGPGAFALANWFLGSIIGRLILFGFSWALFTHAMGGIRHMIQDSGRWMEHPQREYLAQLTLWGGLILTVLVWVAAYVIR